MAATCPQASPSAAVTGADTLEDFARESRRYTDAIRPGRNLPANASCGAKSLLVFPFRFHYNLGMRTLVTLVLLGSVLLPAHAGIAAETDRYAKVANQLVQLINAGDYPGVEKLFNSDMSKALPLDKTTDFFKGLTTQFGKIQKLDEPKRSGEWMVFPAHCERGLLDLSLVLDGQDKVAGLLFRPHTAAASEPAATKSQTELSLPLKGRWLVFWGGDTRALNHHHDVPAQRFAFDLVGVNEKGETHRGDGARNEDYFCFGREILAPADGIVVEAIDGVRDNTPPSMNPYCLVGNCVVIQHRPNEVSVLAHLQRGSVAVKAGESVKRGQLLGKCGNSGNSSEPHLHYHLQDSPIFQGASGIKCVFQKVVVTKDGRGETKANYSPVKGDIISPVG